MPPDKSTPPPATPPATLVDVFQNSGPEALAAIDAQVADLKAEITATQNKIDGLLAIRKALDVKLNGLPQRKPRDPNKPKAVKPVSAVQVSGPPARTATDNDEDDPIRSRVYDFLSQCTGPKSIPAIASALGLDGRSIIQKMRHPWFTQSALGFSIARK